MKKLAINIINFLLLTPIGVSCMAALAMLAIGNPVGANYFISIAVICWAIDLHSEKVTKETVDKVIRENAKKYQRQSTGDMMKNLDLLDDFNLGDDWLESKRPKPPKPPKPMVSKW